MNLALAAAVGYGIDEPVGNIFWISASVIVPIVRVEVVVPVAIGTKRAVDEPRDAEGLPREALGAAHAVRKVTNVDVLIALVVHVDPAPQVVAPVADTPVRVLEVMTPPCLELIRCGFAPLGGWSDSVIRRTLGYTGPIADRWRSHACRAGRS